MIMTPSTALTVVAAHPTAGNPASGSLLASPSNARFSDLDDPRNFQMDVEDANECQIFSSHLSAQRSLTISSATSRRLPIKPQTKQGFGNGRSNRKGDAKGKRKQLEGGISKRRKVPYRLPKSERPEDQGGLSVRGGYQSLPSKFANYA